MKPCATYSHFFIPKSIIQLYMLMINKFSIFNPIMIPPVTSKKINPIFPCGKSRRRWVKNNVIPKQ